MPTPYHLIPPAAITNAEFPAFRPPLPELIRSNNMGKSGKYFGKIKNIVFFIKKIDEIYWHPKENRVFPVAVT
jgi:hypothetical protein